MSKLEDLIAELCPDGVEYKELMYIVNNIVTKEYPLQRPDGEVINLQKDDQDKNIVWPVYDVPVVKH